LYVKFELPMNSLKIGSIFGKKSIFADYVTRDDAINSRTKVKKIV